jgi:hypothetical protein
MRLESGPAKADRNWHLVRAVLFLGFALYFVYDGVIGYPKKNRAEAAKVLAGKPIEGQVTFDQLGERPAEEDVARLQVAKPTSRQQVYDVLGQPTFKAGDEEYFISRYGYAKITMRGGIVNRDELLWKKWYKSKEEVTGQFYWALIPALPGLWFLWRLYKAATLRVVVDDAGVQYDRQRIGWEAMESLRDYSPKGWIDLYYKDGARQKKLRLDNEKVALFDEIVAAICEKKGYANEVQAYAENKAREERERQAAIAAGDAARDDSDQ